ncbi:MAG TPA: ABC transporter permease [Streptosporangiaceae bacterium]|jgi:peptide/nickel transport system permease protein
MTHTLEADQEQPPLDAAGQPAAEEDGRRRGRWRHNLAGLIGAAILLLTVVVSVFARQIAPYGLNDQDLLNILHAPSSAHLLGTDELGRDVLSRVIYGGREALLVTVLAVVLAVLAGFGLGVTAALARGWVDNLLGRLADIQLSIPAILLALVVLALAGSSTPLLVVVLALSSWVLVFRVARAQARNIAAQPYVEAARLAGAGTRAVIRRHVLPGTLPLAIVASALSFSSVLILEASLGFLGLGVQPPNADWGEMIATGQSHLAIAWWASLSPGIALVLVLIGVQLCADWLAQRFSIKGLGDRR